MEIKASEILQDGEHPLISKVTKIILENLNNEKLTIGSIAKELGISRTSLYNKWTQLTGEALNKFILKMRPIEELLTQSTKLLSIGLRFIFTITTHS